MRFRILLHSMTFSRDFGINFILSKLLERFGCECLIVPTEHLYAAYVRHWNPHAVFFTTASHTGRLRQAYPKAKLFLCASEGPADVACDEITVATSRELYDQLEQIYVWGENTYHFLEECIAANDIDYITGDVRNADKSKFRLVGHPRLDLSRFQAPVPRRDKFKIGFMGYSLYINGYKASLIEMILDRQDLHLSAKYSLDTLCLFVSIMNALGSDDIQYSLRPYPVEPRQPYLKSKVVKSGRLLLDDHLDFAAWVGQQDIVVGDLTETYATMYANNTSFVGIYNMLEHYSDIHLTPQIKTLKAYFKDRAPNSLDGIVALCNDRSRMAAVDPNLAAFMHYLFNIDQQHSALALIAQDMIRRLRDTPPRVGRGLIPRQVSRWLADLLLPRSYTSYSYFSMRRIAPKVDQEFTPVLTNILKHPANAPYLTA